MKKLGYIIMPFVIAFCFAIGLYKYLEKADAQMLATKDVRGIFSDTVSLVKDKGIYANDYWAKQGDILMMGSSELSHSTIQHPVYFFNTQRSKNMVVPIGRAYTQSLQDASLVGSLDNSIKDKKVVLLISMQWFMEKNGVTPHHFQTRFSPVLFYGFLDNPKISRENKLEYVERVKYLLSKKPGEFKPELLYANYYTKNSTGDKVVKILLKPYFKARKFAVELKDLGITYRKLKEANNLSEPLKKEKEVNWSYERKLADKMARDRVGKNPYLIDKGYYRRYLKGKEKVFENRYGYVNLLKSKEFDDLGLFLDVCKDLDVEPVVVVIPAKGQFYTKTGITKDERFSYYNKVEQLVENKGFKYIDLRNKEDEKYYLRDIMHLGTKGWVDVCEKLYKEFDQ